MSGRSNRIVLMDRTTQFEEYRAGDVIAWVDESGSNSAKDPGTYILSAAVCFAEDVEVSRATTGKLLMRGQRKLHWIDESTQRRRKIIDSIATLPLEHVVVVRSHPESRDKPERRRRKCLERLLIELEALQVNAAVLESRGTHQDGLDMKMLSHLRTRHTVSTIRLHHKTGPSDPMLWVPDACCGAVVDDRCGVPEFFSQIEGKTTIHLV